MSNEQTAKTRPTHRIFSVTKDGEKTRWTELGAAWAHKDGKGFTLVYTACPIGECDIVLRLIEPKEKKAEQSSPHTNVVADSAAQVAA